MFGPEIDPCAAVATGHASDRAISSRYDQPIHTLLLTSRVHFSRPIRRTDLSQGEASRNRIRSNVVVCCSNCEAIVLWFRQFLRAGSNATILESRLQELFKMGFAAITYHGNQADFSTSVLRNQRDVKTSIAGKRFLLLPDGDDGVSDH